MLKKRRLLVACLALIPMIGLTVAFGQPGGMRWSKGDKGGDKQGGQRGPRGPMDPNMIFNFMSGGQDFIDVNSWIAQSTRRDPSAAERINAFLQQQGITNGRVTRDQFTAFMQQRNGAAPGTPSPGAPNSPNAGPPPIDEQRIRDSFNGRLQRVNSPDGVLRLSDLTSDRDQALRDDFDKWDKNHNGVLEYEEYREYYIARMQARFEQNGGYNQRGDQNVDESRPAQPEEKRVVYRRESDLPKELPSWYAQVQKRNPGQIALYEWKNSDVVLQTFREKFMEAFRKYDRNSDGFITVEEVLAVESAQKKNAPSDRRGAPGAPEAEQPKEETLLVIAGPGADKEDTTAVTLSPGTFPGDGRGAPGRSFNRRDSSNGGNDRGNMGRGGPPRGGNPKRGQ